MDKILPILEKHVQWIALGIGALFLALMAYSYVVQQPVTVKLGTKEVAPGEVDTEIEKSPTLSRLKQEMANGTVPVPTVPPASEQLKEVVLAKIDVPEPAPTGATENVGPKDLPPDITLPSVPKAVFAGFSMDRGLYQWPKHQRPATAPAGQPPVMAPDPAAMGVPAQMEQRDFDWWTGSFDVSLASLTEAFKTAKIDLTDPEVAKTAFLGIELVRQEKQMNGSWGAETLVGPLPEYVPLMREIPRETANRQEKADYMIWAAQHLQMLVQPVFPQVVAGTPWYPPGTEAPPKVAEALIDPAMPVEGGLVPGRPAPAPRPVAPQIQPRQPGALDPAINPVGPGSLPPGFSPGYSPAEGGYTPAPGYTAAEGGYGPSEGGYSTQVAGDASAIPGGGQEGGTFNPQDYVLGAIQQGFQDYPATIYAHDVTILPGKTYRYRLRYYLRNPLFLLDGRVNAEYANRLTLVSGYSEWTPEVIVPPRVEFWVNKVTDRPGVPAEAEFNVFIAKSDRWEPVTVRAMPGDQIAQGESNSGWSLVDIRKESDKYYVYVADTNGRLERRSLETDQNDPRQRELSGIPETQPGLEGGPMIEGIEVPPLRPEGTGGPRPGGLRPGPGRRPPPGGPGFTVDE